MSCTKRCLFAVLVLGLLGPPGCKASSEPSAVDSVSPDQALAPDLSGPEPDLPAPGPSPTVLTVLYDNVKAADGLQADWGFACAVTGASTNVLFDTGADGATLLANSSALGVDPSTFEVVLLSHAHDDHTGGLAAFLEKNSAVQVVVLSSFPALLKQLAATARAVVEVTEPHEIAGGVHTLGAMGTDIPEQALVIETPHGLVVITGCAHPGVVEVVERAKQLLSGQPVLLVMGGFHLDGQPEEEISSIADRLVSLGVKHVGPSHCSGDQARAVLRRTFEDRFVAVGVGAVIRTDEL